MWVKPATSNQASEGHDMKTNTVLSHIVQRRFSDDHENIATDALAFILESSEPARSGLMKLLRGIAPDLPSLRFRIQKTWPEEEIPENDASDLPGRQADGKTRPDMEGFSGNETRVFIENKFWAGFTVNQPVSYLKILARQSQPSVLLMVVPAARQETVWRELLRRLANDKTSVTSQGASVGVVRSRTTGSGPILALTSWGTLLSAIDAELAGEPQTRNDLLQLRGLCEAADNDAFIPISSAEVTDQRTPAFFLQLNSIRESAVEKAITAGFLGTKIPDKNPKKGALLPNSSWRRFGRYVFFPQSGVGPWLGTEFTLWKDQGSTPFPPTIELDTKAQLRAVKLPEL
jgi:hypothetical protein